MAAPCLLQVDSKFQVLYWVSSGSWDGSCWGWEGLCFIFLCVIMEFSHHPLLKTMSFYNPCFGTHWRWRAVEPVSLLDPPVVHVSSWKPVLGCAGWFGIGYYTTFSIALSSRSLWLISIFCASIGILRLYESICEGCHWQIDELNTHKYCPCRHRSQTLCTCETGYSTGHYYWYVFCANVDLWWW